MAYKKRFLDSMDEKDIYDDVNEKKALPELILKQNILNAQDNMLISERRMMSNYRLQKKILKEDRIVFEGDLVLLWGFIKKMVEDQGIKKEDKPQYDLLLRMEYGINDINIRDLIKIRDFLLTCLHRINITNLFQGGGVSAKSEVRNEW